MDAKNIGVFLADLRKKENLMQKDIANLCNVSVQAVSKWERGESIPDIQILEKLSILYKVSINEIINGERKEIFTDIEKRNSIFLLTSSILVMFAYLFNFVSFNNTDEFYGMNIVMKGYQIVFEGINGIFVYLVWAQFLILVSHLLINIFTTTKVVNRTDGISKYVSITSVIGIAIGVLGLFIGFLPFPQILILSAMVVNLVLLGGTINISSYFQRIKKEKSSKKLDILSEILVIVLLIGNSLLSAMAIFDAVDGFINPPPYGRVSHNDIEIIVASIFLIASIISILYSRKFKYTDRLNVSIRFFLINLIFPIVILTQNQDYFPPMGMLVVGLQIIIPITVTYKQIKANPILD